MGSPRVLLNILIGVLLALVLLAADCCGCMPKRGDFQKNSGKKSAALDRVETAR